MREIEVDSPINLKEYYVSEALNTLRTNIEFSGADNKVLLFTSAGPGEGKSTVAYSLAQSFAQNGKRVLFIDADMRKSVFSGKIRSGGKTLKGLSHYLSGQASVEEVLTRINGSSLYAIFSGPVPPNPTELINTDRFKKFIKKSREEFDYVIIDSPPLGFVIDSAILGTASDGAVIVMESEKTSKRHLKEVIEQLNKADCKILGAVLNKVNYGGGSYYYKNHYGKYYGKYYK